MNLLKFCILLLICELSVASKYYRRKIRFNKKKYSLKDRDRYLLKNKSINKCGYEVIFYILTLQQLLNLVVQVSPCVRIRLAT